MSDTPTAPGSFRLNARVVQMVAIVLMALAIPLTVAILGVTRMTARPSAEPDTSVLRSLAESAAEEHFPMPVLDDGRGRISRPVRAQPGIRQHVTAAGGSILPDADRWLVTIPAENIAGFEASMEIRQHARSGVYEITFDQP